MFGANHDPREWGMSGSWTVESEQDALNRAPEFGRRFFDSVFAEFPTLAASTQFLRWSDQPEDVYAVFHLPAGGAGVQIDLVLDLIIVWNFNGQAEYGDWGSDQVPPAVDHFRRIIDRSTAHL